jgi:hypothetical protein
LSCVGDVHYGLKINFNSLTDQIRQILTSPNPTQFLPTELAGRTLNVSAKQLQASAYYLTSAGSFENQFFLFPPNHIQV